MMATRTAKNINFLISKKKLYKCSTLSCTFFWRCFATRQRETSQLHILYRKCRMCSPQFLLLVSLVAFFFTAAHCHLAGRQNFSFSNRQVSCFSSDEIRLFCSVSNALPLSLLSTPVKTKKCSQTRFCPGGHAMTRQKTQCCIWVAIPVDRVISHWYACGADGTLTVTLFPNFLGCLDNQIFLLIVLRCALDFSLSPTFS